MPNADAQLEARCGRYRQLMERHMPVLFPQGVDIALNSDEPLDELLGSDDYAARCRVASKPNAELYRTDQWTPHVLARGELPDGTLLVDALCESWLRHLRSYWLFDWQEHRAELRHAIIIGAGDYVPGEVRSGVYEPQSYVAWLNVYVFPSAIRRLKREHNRNVRTVFVDLTEEDSDGFPELRYEAQLAELADEHMLREAIACALSRFSWTRRTRDMVDRLSFHGESMRAVGLRHGISHVQVGRLLKPLREAFIGRLSHDYPESQHLKPFDLPTFMGLIGRLFERDRFVGSRLCPVD